MHDVLIVGGGVIGLSLAWELAQSGQKVRVIDRGQAGREASWAGAGILPAANLATAIHPYDQLCGLACQLHPRWAELLQSLTGIDTGYRRCGGLYLARTAGDAAALAAWAADQAVLGVTVERLGTQELATREPGLICPGGRGSCLPETRRAARSPAGSAPQERRPPSPQPPAPSPSFFIPDEAQLRNPRHLQALIAACTIAGVEITPGVAAQEVELAAGQVTAISSDHGPLRACRYCFTAGAWTGPLLSLLGLPLAVLPIRGQMVLFRCEQPPIRHIVIEGARYLVPRDDGRVLAGSTEEEVGFDKRTTEEGIAELTDFARGLVPALAEAPIERTWAGLRPASFDGLPYLGSLPGLSNAFVAAGHFRSGLFLSPATAVVMSQLLRGEPPQIDLSPFRVGR